MPTRIIREGILTSPRINRLSESAELFYRRLMSVVDDHGRFHATLMILRASCYPMKLDTVKDAAIQSHLDEALAAGLLTVYAANGLNYLQLLDFGQRVQSKSKFPDPPVITDVHGNPPCPTVENRLVVVVDEGVVVDVPRKRATVKTPMPDGFQISERVKAWAEDKGHARLEERFEHFKGAAMAKGYTYANWDDALMNAIRDNWAKISTPIPDAAPAGGRRRLG